MSRPEMSATEIQAEVKRQVQQLQGVGELRETIVIPLPAPLLRFDSTGCNWYMAYGGIAGEHGHAVRDVVEQVKAQWNLRV